MDDRVRRALCFVVAFVIAPRAAAAEDPDQGGEVADDKPAAPVAASAAPPRGEPGVAGADPALPPVNGGSKFTWTRFGFLRLQYKAIQNDPNVEFVGRDDGFELQNARIGVRGTLGDSAAFVVSFD